MVWVKRMKWGEEQIHWVIKFHIEDKTQNYWLDPGSAYNRLVTNRTTRQQQ